MTERVAADQALVQALRREAEREEALPVPPIAPVVERIGPIAGWLEADEARLLTAAAWEAVDATGGLPIVELGSYAGRGTIALASMAAAHPSRAAVVAVDRFDGVVGEASGKLYHTGPTLDLFRQNMAATGHADAVEVVVGGPAKIEWDRQIALLVVDGLHDYASVSADFRHYEPWLSADGLVAFHDVAPYYPGVQRVVRELVASGRYTEVARSRSLVILRPVRWPTTQPAAGMVAPEPRAADRSRPRGPAGTSVPLVSCIMPTFDRRAYVPTAIRLFLDQDYPERELLIVDDGTDPIGDLVPADARIRYIRLTERRTIGAKRNLACEEARGDVFAHWDDDDWVANWRLRYQVEALTAQDAELVGIQTLLYLDRQLQRGWRFRYRGGGPWVHDPTFCYRREIWERQRFPDSNYGLDLTFLRRGPRKRVGVLDDYRFYVGALHAGNTSPKRTRGSSWEPYDPGSILALMAAGSEAPPPTSRLALEPSGQSPLSL